jgi:hypothetical protein
VRPSGNVAVQPLSAKRGQEPTAKHDLAEDVPLRAGGLAWMIWRSV